MENSVDETKTDDNTISDWAKHGPCGSLPPGDGNKVQKKRKTRGNKNAYNGYNLFADRGLVLAQRDKTE